jgi:hypothetical protein
MHYPTLYKFRFALVNSGIFRLNDAFYKTYPQLPIFALIFKYNFIVPLRIFYVRNGCYLSCCCDCRGAYR